MRILNCDQKSNEWLTARVGRVTASEADNLLTPLFKIKEGDGPKTYLCRKVAEAHLKRPLEGFSAWETDQGIEAEMDARNWFALEYPQTVKQVGFVIGDDERCGCSPDGLLDDDGGIEIKCPQPTNHVRYLLDGKLPPDYAAQVHFSMFVTGRPYWMFVSYRRRFPAFVLRVERDEAIMEKIGKCLESFYRTFDQALERLKPTP